MEIRGFLDPGTTDGRLATAEEVRQAVLAIEPGAQVDVVEADGAQLVTVRGDTGVVTFTTGAYPETGSDGRPYYQGWAWRADVAGIAASPLERTEHWRALVFWPVM